MDVLATLDRVALMILARYVRLGGENESIDETMEELGLSNRNYFYRCRSQLYKAGLLTRDGKLLFGSPQPQTVPQRTPQIESAPEPEPVPVDDLIPVGSVLSRIVKADAMDESGDRNRRGTPFQARRKAQIAALQQAFAEFWPEHQLIEANAKDLLNLAGDYAEVVYEALEKARGRDLTGHPVNYVRGILRRQREEESGPQVKPVNLEREEEGTIMLSAPDPVLARAEAKAREKMPWLWEVTPDDD